MKIDMHVHTGNVSSCGRVSGHDLACLYKEAGYQAVVITDHYYDGFFSRLKGHAWEKQIGFFLSGFREAQRTGEYLGLTVMLGMEIRFQENGNDYLIYGITEAFLRRNPELYRDTLKQFKERIQRENILIYQAHPYRIGIRPAHPGLIDGVEVFNGNRRHDSRNRLAYQFAVQNRLPMISGSDFHQTEDLGRGGIIVPENINNSEELVHCLKENKNIRLIGMNEISA